MSNASSTQTAAERKRSTVKAIAASTIGSTLEWYDFILFGTASALVFNKLFFPDFDPLMGTLAAFAANAVGFLIRPLGGIVFGNLGDKYGRKFVMVFTLILMGVATTVIGLLPTYAQIGIWAPLLLLLLRVLQGLGAGAEYGGAVVLVAEYAPKNRKGLFTSIPGAGVALGLILGSGFFSILTATLSDEAFLSWGWRIPFVVSILGVGVGIYIRMSVDETPEFTMEKAKAPTGKGTSPVREVFRNHRRSFFVAIFSAFAENGTSYLAKTFSLTYIATFLMMEKSVGLNAVLIASVVSLFTFPFFGNLGDKLGIKKVYATSAMFVALFAFPFFWIMDTRSTPLVFLAIIVLYSIGVRGMSATQGAYLSSLFPTKVRFTGVATAREIASAFAGGLAPIIGTALLAWTGQYWPVALYIIGLALITIVAVLWGPGRREQEALDADADVAEARRELSSH